MIRLTDKAVAKERVAHGSPNRSRSEVVLIASRWPAARGAPAGRILVHATDPLLLDLSGLELGTTTSAAEQIASGQPGARVVKRSRPLPPKSLKSGVRGRQVFLRYCGNDGAQAKVNALATESAFTPLASY